jgi:hypothetical protein
MAPPEVWGPPIWTLFHVLAEKINEAVYPRYVGQLLNIMKIICSALPCPECTRDASSFLAKISLQNLKTKEDFKNMVYLFHNWVNAKKRKPLYNYSNLVIYKKYNIVYVFNRFISVYHTKGNMRLLAESFQRQNILKNVREWFSKNIYAFTPSQPENNILDTSTDKSCVVPEETPVVPEETPVVLEETPVVPEETPVVPEETPVVPEETPVVTEEMPVVTEEMPVVPEETQVVPEETPVVTEEIPVVTEEMPVVTEEMPVVPETPVVTEEMPVVTEVTQVVPEETPVVPEETPVVTEEMPVVTEETPVVEEDKSERISDELTNEEQIVSEEQVVIEDVVEQPKPKKNRKKKSN